MATDTTPHTLEAVSAARWRVALTLTVAMMAVYFGFILLGVLVIVAAWVLTWVYIRWANTHYDSRLSRLKR